MLKFMTILPGLALPLLVGGCYSVSPEGQVQPPNSSVASWQMPWQLDPISRQSVARGERIARAYVPGTGYVRGTRQALASVGHELPVGPGPNRTVETCRQTVAGEAEKIGAKQVEAVSAGPEHVDAKGHYVAPVLIRVNYARHGGHEVREAVLTCIVDQNDKIVDAFAGSRRRV